jgi:asparagine synthase (glutamine-hydrolysing)
MDVCESTRDKMINKEHPMEKWVVVKPEMLPPSVLGDKEQFSDGVGYVGLIN